MSTEEQTVDKFAKYVIRHLRDPAMDFFREVTTGKPRFTPKKILANNLKKFSDEDLKIIEALVLECVDESVCSMLASLYVPIDPDVKEISFSVNNINVPEIHDWQTAYLNEWSEKYSKYETSFELTSALNNGNHNDK